MVRKSVRRSVIAVDPMFAIPDGVDELVYEEEGYFVEDQGELDEESSDSFFEDDDAEDEDDYSETPDTPDILGVISQSIRTDAAGNQVVDLVLDVEDIPGNYEYDFKVAKV